LDERDGFYFHRSFWESIELMKTKDQLALFKAITIFALNGIEPEKLTSEQKASWVLIRPVLAKGRNKAANGKQGGSKKKANSKQTGSKKEAAGNLPLSDKGLGSNSNELRLGTGDEGISESPAPNDGKLFTAFWEAYPDKCARDAAWEAWKQLNPDSALADQIMRSLDAWKKSAQWTDQNGKFIPRAAKWLAEGHWHNIPLHAPEKKDIPLGASGRLGEAELEAIRRTMAEPLPPMPCEEEMSEPWDN